MVFIWDEEVDVDEMDEGTTPQRIEWRISVEEEEALWEGPAPEEEEELLCVEVRRRTGAYVRGAMLYL